MLINVKLVKLNVIVKLDCQCYNPWSTLLMLINVKLVKLNVIVKLDCHCYNP